MNIFHAIIFYNFRRGLIHQQCFDELSSIFGDEAPSGINIYRGYDECNRSRSSHQGLFPEGLSKSVVFDAVHQLILQNRHITYSEIAITLGISGIAYIQYCMNI